MATVIFDPAKEKPIPRKAGRQFRVKGGVVVLEPGINEVSDELLLEAQKDNLWQGLVGSGAIAVSAISAPSTDIPEQKLKTVSERTTELEAILKEQGYRPIEELAHNIGITQKPAEGWKAAIPAIVQHELESSLIKNDE